MDKSRIIEKIKKCLALSRSANEHEAAAALRQAQKLMAQYRIDMSDVDMSDIAEMEIGASVKKTPPTWENNLMCKIAEALGCKLLFRSFSRGKANWVFIGGETEVEIAKYAAQVMMRQCRAARKTYIETSLCRCGASRKTARADMFCLGWVISACKLLERYEQHPALDGYLERRNYNGLSGLDSRDRAKSAGLHGRSDASHGYQAGKSAQLHDGVGAGAQRKMIGG